MSEQAQEQQQDLPAEERARMVGWQPGGKLDAEAFLDRREEHMGAMRADNNKLEHKVHHMSATIDAMAKHQEKMNKQQFEAGYNRAIAEQKARMDKAAEEGDSEVYFEAKGKAEQLQSQKDEGLKDESRFAITPAEEKKDEPGELTPLQRDIRDYAQKNPVVFGTEEQRVAWLKELQFQATVQENQAAAFEAASRAVVQKFNLQRSPPGSESGDQNARSGGGNVAFDDIPAADKEVYYRFRKRFGEDYTKEKFMKEYNS